MSFNRYLSELDGERLAELFDTSRDVLSEEAAETGGMPVRMLYDDLRKTYPGLVAVAEHIWQELNENDDNDYFLAGAKAGSLLMLHTVRLTVEHDEIGSIE